MKALRSPWVSGALAVVAVAFVCYQLLQPRFKRGRPAKVESPAPAIAAPQPKAASVVAPAKTAGATNALATARAGIDRRIVQARFAEWIDSPQRDPFFFANAPAPKAAEEPPSPVPNWRLTGIWRQTGTRVAAINGRVYQEGDQIEGYKIERIESDQVWFQGPAKKERLGFNTPQTGTNAIPAGASAAAQPGSARLGHGGLLEKIEESIDAGPRSFAVGTKFPGFSEKDLNGRPLSLADYKGKVALVDFWATWCGPCLLELPNVLATYDRYHPRGFEIVGISLDQDEQKLRAFTRDRNMNWQQFFDGKGWQNRLALKYGVESIPVTYLLDANGTIIGKDLRGPDLERAVATALAKK